MVVKSKKYKRHRVCWICGVYFLPKIENQHGCCGEHQNKLIEKGLVKVQAKVKPGTVLTCANCGKSFVYGRNKKFCSKECAEAYRKEVYGYEQKRNKEMQELRKNLIARAGVNTEG